MAAVKRNRYPAIERRREQTGDIISIAENIELLTGARGDGLERAITWGDAANAGLIDLVDFRGRYTGFKPGSGLGGSSSSQITTAETPSKPANVVASGAFTAIYISWDAPSYAGHSYSEIWRASSDNFGLAVRIGTEIGNIFADPVGMGSTYYYWVRHVNINDVPGPIHDTHGALGQTAANVGEIMDELGEKLSESQLSQNLNSRINLIDAPATGLIERLNQEISARQQGDSQLQVQIESIVLSNIADVYYQADMPTGTIAENSRWFDTNDGNHPYLYLNGSWQDVSDQRILDLQAAVTTEQAARLSADTAQADQINAIQASITSPTTGLSANATAINSLSGSVSSIGNTLTAHTNQFSQIQAVVGNDYSTLQTIRDVTVGAGGLSAQHYIKTDVNGRIAGYGLYNSGATSQFIVLADTFAISHPSAPTKYPFIIDAGQIYMDTVLIKDGSIQNAKIQSLTADKITAGILDVARLGANSITADKIDSRNLTIKDSLGNIIFGSGNNLDVSRVAGLGALATASSVSSALLAAGYSANTLTNAAFKSTSDRWYFSSGGSEISAGRNFAGWTLIGEGTLFIQQLGSASQDSFWYTDHVAVSPGMRLEAFAYTGAHRCQVEVKAAFYDTAGAYITEQLAGVNNQESAGGTALSGYKKTGGFVVVPAGAARAMFFVRKGVTVAGQSSSYAFISRCFLGEAHAGQTELSPWSDGSMWSRFGTLDILNAANISTYMAAAAIGDAYIQNLTVDKLIGNTANWVNLNTANASVGTLKIAGNAATVPVGAYIAGAGTTLSVVASNPDTIGAQNIFLFGHFKYSRSGANQTLNSTTTILKNGVAVYNQVNAISPGEGSTNNYTHVADISAAILLSINAGETATFTLETGGSSSGVTLAAILFAR